MHVRCSYVASICILCTHTSIKNMYINQIMGHYIQPSFRKLHPKVRVKSKHAII